MGIVPTGASPQFGLDRISLINGGNVPALQNPYANDPAPDFPDFTGNPSTPEPNVAAMSGPFQKPSLSTGGKIRQLFDSVIFSMAQGMGAASQAQDKESAKTAAFSAALMGPQTQRDQNLKRQYTQAQIDDQKAQAQQRLETIRLQGQQIMLPNGVILPYPMAVKLYPELVKQQGALTLEDRKQTGRKELAQINQGVPVPVTPEMKAKFGIKTDTIGDKVFARLQGIEGRNIVKTSKIVNGVPHQVFQDKTTGEVVHDNGIDSAIAINSAKMYALKDAQARMTPFQTFDENGNLVTISAKQAIATGVPAAGTWNQLFGATGSTKSQGQAAGAVAEHIPEFRDSVQKLAAKGELGPVMGRLNSYLASGYGGNDPDVAEFVTTVGLLKSGAVRAHFGARGGAQILDKFDKMLNTAQTPEALLGSINGIESFLTTYKNVGANPNTPKTSVKNPNEKVDEEYVRDPVTKKLVLKK